MGSLGTRELVAQLTIWKQKNAPDNGLLELAIERLEQQADRIEAFEERVEFLLTHEMP